MINAILEKEEKRLNEFMEAHGIDLFYHYNREGSPSDNPTVAYVQGQIQMLRSIKAQIKTNTDGR